VCAAVVAGSTQVQWSTDAKREIRMQEITFAKGNELYLKDCRDALCQSTLGEIYFSSPGSAEDAILEGIHQENLYVAVIDEECVGFTYIIPKGAFHSFPYLHIIAVKEGYRNMGIGKALLDYSEKIAYEMADKFFLVVADYNPDAKRFYERNGYQQVGEIPNLYRSGVTEYMMAKDLKSD
jgi:ribosomal protein S18 acetylase RimI-like enzyme